MNYNAEHFQQYSPQEYVQDVAQYGIKPVWQNICRFVLERGETDFLRAADFSELYEIGLAELDKRQKKKSGQYFTPKDVAAVMARWLTRIEAKNVCDVACGTGELIAAYLREIGQESARTLLKEGRVYLYDSDEVAVQICKTVLQLEYGADVARHVHAITDDFLNESTRLPPDCKVIANPPYAAVDAVSDGWEQTEVLRDTRELYAVFTEKILKQSAGSVVITPYSFIGGSKFYSLRKLMNERRGFVVSFDNVPGNIFCGKKHGVFNTNTSNSVRAAITVTLNPSPKKGYRLSPLIRFKTEERERLLRCNVLENFLEENEQLVGDAHPMYRKCRRELGGLFARWEQLSSQTLGDYLAEDGAFALYVPNTCRYFTVASSRELKRSGQFELRFAEQNVFAYAFCMLNSSFAYWHWRLYDGGITYPKSLLLSLPVFFDRLTLEDIAFFRETADEMIARAEEFLVTKNNVGVQENIKYPEKYRQKINRRLFKILGVRANPAVFDAVHANSAFSEGEEETDLFTRFYRLPSERVIFDKRERDKIWSKAKKKAALDVAALGARCPALAHRVEMRYRGGKNIQSAVFSECVYAQTLANMLGLSVFVNCVSGGKVPAAVQEILSERAMVPRYLYCNEAGTRILVQAGGCGGVDCVFISLPEHTSQTIEFKERDAKASEHDLPKYGQDGALVVSRDFLEKYPQFSRLLQEHADLNFFEHMGSNVGDFSKEAVREAIFGDSDKHADYVCTEDCNGILVLLPLADITKWARPEAEIRTAGRNSAKVWTPDALQKFLQELGAKVHGGAVSVPRKNLKERTPRGGTAVTGLKITPLFYVPVKYVTEEEGIARFEVRRIRQLKATVAGKLFFDDLDYDRVKNHYFPENN